jgi:hypothetical protein
MQGWDDMDDTLLDALLTMIDPHAALAGPEVRVLLRLGLSNGQVVEGNLITASEYVHRLDEVTHGEVPPIEWANDDGLIHLDRVTYNDSERGFADQRSVGAILLHRRDIVTTQVIGVGPS